MVKSPSYHQLLCAFIENDCVRERCDYQWQRTELTTVKDILLRTVAPDRWNVYIVHEDPTLPGTFTYRTLYHNMELEMAEILCSYAKRVYGLREELPKEKEQFFQLN